MKILHTCLSCFYIDNYTYQENMLPKYHVKMGNEVTVLASLVSFDEHGKSCLLKQESTYMDKNGYKIIRMNYKHSIIPVIFKTLRIYTHTYQVLQQESPDIIFVHGGAFWDAKKIIKYKKLHPNVKLFVDSHADYINSATNWISKNILHRIIWRYIHQKLLPYTEKFWGVTPLRCDFLVSEYNLPKDKVEFLPMGVDDDIIPMNRQEINSQIRSNLNIKQSDFIIVTGGKIDKRKNIHHLLNVVEKLNNDKIHVIIFGVLALEMIDSFNRYLKNNHFHFVGWSNDSDIINYLVASNLACYPGTHSTLWEESVGVGTPCIFKRWNHMDHVNVNNNCIFVKGDDEDELFQCINSVIFTDKYNNLIKNALDASIAFRYSDIARRAIMSNNN